MEENYRWIKVRIIKSGVDVYVRQREDVRGAFYDSDGNVYDITELDFTQIPEEPLFMTDYKERMQKQEEEHEKTQNQLRDMLSAMDARAIADHQALIDERAYWRKLRGDIFLEILKESVERTSYGTMIETTRYVFDELYDQDKDFFELK